MTARTFAFTKTTRRLPLKQSAGKSPSAHSSEGV